MEISNVVANILELAKLEGKSEAKSMVVFDNFKDLVTDTNGDGEQYEKIATACIVGAGIKRGLWSAPGWTPAPRDGVLCWTKDGYEPIAITLRAKKLTDGTAVTNTTSGDKTHKTCVAYMGAVKKFLGTGGVIGDLPTMTWNQIVDRNAKYEKDGTVKPDKMPKTEGEQAEALCDKLVSLAPKLDAVTKSRVLSILASHLS